MSRIRDIKKYIDYMKSNEWKEKANLRKQIDDYQCTLCGSIGELEVHHISYRRLTNEDVYQDLVTVCPRCHVLLHNYYKRIKAPKAQRR